MSVTADRGTSGPIQTLAERYTFRDPDAIRAYLTDNPELVPLLRYLADIVPSYFGADVPLTLELSIDPEGDGAPALFALVRTVLPWEQALQRLDRLGDDWWLGATEGAGGKLTLDIEFG